MTLVYSDTPTLFLVQKAPDSPDTFSYVLPTRAADIGSALSATFRVAIPDLNLDSWYLENGTDGCPVGLDVNLSVYHHS